MDFKWLPGKVGTPVIVPAPTPDAPPIAGVIVPPATDITLRTVHSTWQGGIASTVIIEFLPLVGIHLSPSIQTVLIGLLTGGLALMRSFLAHRRLAQAAKVPPANVK